MIRRIVGWIVLVPFCVLLIVFSLANRQLVVVNFNPLAPAEALASPGVGVPLFIVIFSVLLFGVVLGGVAMWFTQGRVRREKRHWRKETEYLTRELEALRRNPAPPDGRMLAEVDDLMDRH